MLLPNDLRSYVSELKFSAKNILLINLVATILNVRAGFSTELANKHGLKMQMFQISSWSQTSYVSLQCMLKKKAKGSGDLKYLITQNSLSITNGSKSIFKC